jgi:hypothetical protein
MPCNMIAMQKCIAQHRSVTLNVAIAYCLLVGIGIHTTDHTQQAAEERGLVVRHCHRASRETCLRGAAPVEKDNRREVAVAEAPRQRQRRRLHFGGLAILLPAACVHDHLRSGRIRIASCHGAFSFRLHCLALPVDRTQTQQGQKKKGK